jgi:hypothetical protein
MAANDAIKAALEQFGYPAENVKTEQADAPHLYKVWLDGRYFGIWDELKSTFVD